MHLFTSNVTFQSKLTAVSDATATPQSCAIWDERSGSDHQKMEEAKLIEYQSPTAVRPDGSDHHKHARSEIN